MADLHHGHWITSSLAVWSYNNWQFSSGYVVTYIFLDAHRL